MLSAEFFPKILNANVVNNILLKIQQITTPQVQAITYAELNLQLQGQDITNLHIFSKMLELKLELDQDHLDEEIVMFIVPILIYQLDKQLSQNIALSTINCLLYIIGDGSQFADILQAYQIHSKLFQILSKRVITSQILIGQILLLLNYVSDSIYYRQQTIMNDYLYYSIQYLEGESQETYDNAGIIFWSIKSMISTNYEHLPQKRLYLEKSRSLENKYLFKVLYQVIFNQDTIRSFISSIIHLACLLIELKMREQYNDYDSLSFNKLQNLLPVLIHLLAQSISPLIVLSTLNSLQGILKIFNCRLIQQEIHLSLMYILRIQSEIEILSKVLSMISDLAYDNININRVSVQNSCLCYFINFIDNGIEDNWNIMRSLRLMSVNIKEDPLLVKQYSKCIPPIVKQLIRNSAKPRNQFYSILTLSSLLIVDLQELLCMHEQEISQFIKEIVNISCLIEKNNFNFMVNPSNQIISSMMKDETLMKIIIDQGYFERTQFYPWEININIEVLEVLKQYSKQLQTLPLNNQVSFASPLIKSTIFQKIISLLIENQEFMNQYIFSLNHIAYNLLKLNTQFIDEQLCRLGILQIFQNNLTAQDCDIESKLLCLQCVLKILENGRVNNDEIENLITKIQQMQTENQDSMMIELIKNISFFARVNQSL